MAVNDRLKYLHVALILVGVIFLAGIYPLMIIGRPAGHGIRVTRTTR